MLESANPPCYIAALSVGEYLAAAEAMFIVLVGEGLESYAAGRTEAAILKFVEHLPRRANVLRDGETVEVPAESLLAGEVIVVRAGLSPRLWSVNRCAQRSSRCASSIAPWRMVN